AGTPPRAALAVALRDGRRGCRRGRRGGNGSAGDSAELIPSGSLEEPDLKRHHHITSLVATLGCAPTRAVSISRVHRSSPSSRCGATARSAILAPERRVRRVLGKS